MTKAEKIVRARHILALLLEDAGGNWDIPTWVLDEVYSALTLLGGKPEAADV